LHTSGLSLPIRDIAALFGEPFAASGFDAPVSLLAPGTYDLVFDAHSLVTNGFGEPRSVRITVR
jgi:hypothetical protein